MKGRVESVDQLVDCCQFVLGFKDKVEGKNVEGRSFWG